MHVCVKCMSGCIPVYVYASVYVYVPASVLDDVCM